MAKKLLIISILLLSASLLMSCGMTAKETEVEDIQEAPFGYNAENILSTNSPTFNINDTFGAVSHNEWSIVYCSNNTKAYLSISGRDGVGFNTYNIYRSDLINGVWTEPTLNGLENINDFVAKNIVFFVSEDGERMYFSSDRAGGIGNQDIYLATKNVGVWQTPMNLGSTINSTADDMYCKEGNSGNELYFSSNNTLNGDFNILRSWKNNGVWQEPTSDIFEFVNKSAAGIEDLGPVLSADGDVMYFSSNRYDGKWRFYKSTWLSNKWDYPVMIEIANIFSLYNNIMCFMSGNDNKIYFTSNALTAGDSINDFNLWTIERK